jgi:hypothetical protein
MKKVYLLLAISLLGYMTGNAQLQMKTIDKGKLISKKKNNSSVAKRNITTPATSNSVLWSDDFSLQSNWVISNAPGTAHDLWVIGIDPPAGPVSSTFMGAINSTTSANGFALFDSDLYCSHDQIANLTTAHPIDLTGHSNIRLEFDEFYKRWHDSTYIYVSNDNINWTKYEVNGAMTVTDATTNPLHVALDISATAGNQDSVYIRFQFYSPDTNLTGPDTESGCAYAWMIDDVSLSELPPTDGALVKANVGEYAMVPILQAQALQVRGRFLNNGANPISGAKINFVISDPNGNQVYDTSNASGTINPGDTSAYLMGSTTISASVFGDYSVSQTLVVAGDTVMSNDAGEGKVFVNDSMYARSYATVDTSEVLNFLGFNSATGSLGQIYHNYQNSQFTSVSAFLGFPTEGDRISVSVYSVVADTPATMLATSPEHIITADEAMGGFITLGLPTPVTITGGSDYFVCVNQLDGFISIAVSDNIYTPNTTFAKSATTGWGPFESAGFKVALIVNPNNPEGTLNGIPESPAKSAKFNVYPNPVNDFVYITGKGVSEKKVTINILNNLGQVVKTEYHDSFVNTKIDLSKLPAGVYTVNIRNSSGEENKSIVVR